MTEIDLTPYKIVRPEKVRWRFPLDLETSILDLIPSKSLRKFLRNLNKYMAEKNLRYERVVVTEKIYETWFNFYLQKMKEHNYRVVATADWLQQKKAEGKKVEGLFIYQGEELVSAGMIVKRSDKTAILAMSAGEHLHVNGRSNASLGAILNYLFFVEMKKEGFNQLSGGKSPNAFGVFNSLGYLEYKLRIGYVPSAEENTRLLSTVPTNQEGIAIFFGTQEQMFTQFIFVPKGKEFVFEAARLSSPHIPHQEIQY